MHELILFGQVPRARHEQVLKILSGLTAMQPHSVLERHIIYKPVREPEEPGSHLKRGGTQNVAQKQKQQATTKDLYFTRLVQKLTEEDFKSTHISMKENRVHQSQDSSSSETSTEAKWAYQFQDLPLPDNGNRGVLIRMVTSTDIIGGDPHAYMADLGNKFVSEYYEEGHRFVHENIVIFLHRVLQEPGVRSIETSPRQSLPESSALQPLDPSSGYILQCTIRVQDLSNPAIVDAGVEELKKFKARMKGCVELDAPDRLLLDTRVKYQPRTVVAPGAGPAQVVAR